MNWRTPCSLRDLRKLHRGERADFPSELRIEVSTGIVGNGRQVNDRVGTRNRDFVDIADVGLEDA